MATNRKKEFDKAVALWRKTDHGVSAGLRKWVTGDVVKYHAMASKTRTVCMHCGKTFDTGPSDEGDVVICPHCHCELITQTTRKRKEYNIFYVQELTVSGKHQVIKTYMTEVYSKQGESARVDIRHCYDWYINAEGQEVLFSTPLSAFFNYRANPWSQGDMRPVKRPNVYMRSDWTISGLYPHKRLQPWARRMGFGRQVDKLDNYNLLKALMVKPYVETLLKAKEDWWCRYFVYHEKEWPNVRIALRHGYDFKGQHQLWLDYLSSLESLGRDTRNPALICPSDLQAAHDRTTEEINIRDARERAREEERNHALLFSPKSKENKSLARRIAPVAGWVISDGQISIAPLHDVRDFFNEGSELHHCVYAAGYYSRKDSLILGARVSGKRTETIEVSLRDFSIRQCRGSHNQDSPFHEAILSLARQGIPSLMAAYRNKKTGQGQESPKTRKCRTMDVAAV